MLNIQELDLKYFDSTKVTNTVLNSLDRFRRCIPLIDMDQMFYASSNPSVLNDEVMVSEASPSDYINRKLFFNMDGQIEFVMSCACKKLVGNHLEGFTCPECGSPVCSEFTNHLSHKNWIRIPEEHTHCKVLHPAIYLILKSFLGKMNYEPLLHTILNPAKKLPSNLKPIIREQSFKYFEEHYDEILDFFLYKYSKTALKARKSPYWEMFFKVYRSITFCSHLPFLDPVLHPINKSGTNKISMDPIAAYAIKAVSGLVYSTYEGKRMVVSKNHMAKKLFKSYVDYMSYSENILQNKIGSKFGLFRKHIFGARVHHSARAVAVPLHEYTMDWRDAPMADEIHLPWNIACHNFKPYILNHLIKRHNYTHNDATIKWKRALTKYDAFVHEIMNNILKEAPGGRGFPILLNRNPCNRAIS